MLRPPLPSILEASSFSVEEEASSSVRSRVGCGSGLISAAPRHSGERSYYAFVQKRDGRDAHDARLECVVVVGKIAKDFADAIDDIFFFFFFFAFYERCVSKGDFLRRSRRLFAERICVLRREEESQKVVVVVPLVFEVSSSSSSPTPRVSK